MTGVTEKRRVHQNWRACARDGKYEKIQKKVENTKPRKKKPKLGEGEGSRLWIGQVCCTLFIKSYHVYTRKIEKNTVKLWLATW